MDGNKNSQKSESKDENTKSSNPNQGSNGPKSKQTNSSSTSQGPTSSETYQQRVERKMAEYEQEMTHSKTRSHPAKEGITTTVSTNERQTDVHNSTSQTQKKPPETYQERVDRKMAEYEQEKQPKIENHQANKKITNDGPKNDSNSTGQTQSNPPETYQERVDRKMAEYEKEKQSKTESRQATNVSEHKKDSNSTAQAHIAPRETYQDHVDRKMAEYEEEQKSRTENRQAGENAISATASRNHSNTGASSTNANTTSNETYEDRVERKMAEYERENASNTNSNNNIDEHARNEIPNPATGTAAVPPSDSPNDSQPQNNENSDLVNPGDAQADGVQDRPSLNSTQSTVLSGTPNSRVHKAVLNDKGVDNRAAYLENADASQRENRPGVFFEQGRGPGSIPVWARRNPNSAPSGPPDRQAQSLIPTRTNCADEVPPPRRYNSARPNLGPNSYTAVTVNPSSSPEEVTEDLEASSPDSNVGATGVTVTPIESTSGQTEESPTNTNSSLSMANGATLKSSETSWYCRKSVLVTSAILLLVAISLGVIVPLLSNGNSKSQESTGNSPSNEEDSKKQKRQEDVLKILADVSTSTLIQQSGTPQQLAFDWIVEEDRLSSPQNTEKLKSRYALAVLYFATGGEFLWLHKENWLDGEVDECDWELLTCSESDVTKIQIWDKIEDGTFRGNGLVGTLPWEDLAMLTSLEVFDVIRNSKLSGTIDPSISSFTNLRNLYLQYNDLSGTIPDELFELSTLEVLALGGNGLEGSVPTSIGQLSNLVELGLRLNSFTGTIPETLYDLTSLEFLSLSYNMLSSTVSTEIGLLTNLEYLSLHGNPIASSLPTELGLLIQLTTFDFRFTEIVGVIPEELCALQESFGLEKLCCNDKIVGEKTCCSEECQEEE